MSMLNNSNGNMLSQFLKFKSDLEQSGKDPQKMLDAMISSGKVTKEQVEQARNQAMFFKSILGGR